MSGGASTDRCAWFWRLMCWLNLYHDWRSDYHGGEVCKICEKVFEWH